MIQKQRQAGTWLGYSPAKIVTSRSSPLKIQVCLWSNNTSSNNIMKRHAVMLIEVMKQPISKKRKGSHYSQVSEVVFSWTAWRIRLIFILLYLYVGNPTCSKISNTIIIKTITNMSINLFGRGTSIMFHNDVEEIVTHIPATDNWQTTEKHNRSLAQPDGHRIILKPFWRKNSPFIHLFFFNPHIQTEILPSLSSLITFHQNLNLNQSVVFGGVPYAKRLSRPINATPSQRAA